MYPQVIKPVVLALLTLLFAGSAFAVFTFDDDIPELNERVARLTFVSGSVQVRRAETEEWEQAVVNLPIVEGDEIVSDSDGRFEIQFAPGNHLRGDGRTTLRIVTLKHEGVALSVPEGSVNVRLTEFDSSTDFFEIDAPETTVALQSAGRYRIDAGASAGNIVRVSVFDAGEARIYSATSGFTLRSGRSARVFIDGQWRGEWELTDSAALADSFDLWARDRDDQIDRSLRNAHYGSYYDRDIYGADELNSYGDWVYTRDYGYIWRPWQRSISAYSDWSPYRYGHWRWVPPFGWTWVNDEPWGWATYHHGRWVWYNGYWHWSPYGYQRYSRSWWRPALVVFTTNRNNYCWYPLPYYSPYYNYNHHYYSRRYQRPRGGTWGGNDRPGPVPTVTPKSRPAPQPQPPVSTPILTPEQRRAKMTTPPMQNIPPQGVITVPKEEFGRQRGGYRTPPLSTAREVLAKAPSPGETPPILPEFPEVRRGLSPAIKAEAPVARAGMQQKTGAAERRSGAPLDGELKTRRIFGNRPPLSEPQQRPVQPDAPAETKTRTRTGVFDRPAGSSPPIFAPPLEEQKQRETSPAETKRREVPVIRQERRSIPTPPVQKQPEEAPRYEPPRRAEPPAQRTVPRYEPPARRDEPKPAPPVERRESRPAPPVERKESRPAPPAEPKETPPTQKSEPSRPTRPSFRSGKDPED